MKIYAEVMLTQVDWVGVKGEDFDQAIEDAISEIEIEGWEVSRVSISRESVAKRQGRAEQEKERLRTSIVRLAKLVDTHQGDEPSDENNEYTNAEMLAWQVLCSYGEDRA